MSTLQLNHPVLVDVARAPRSRMIAIARDIGLVIAGVVVLTALSQVAIPLPFTPVPLTLGTFGALLVGASLGPARGISALASYAALAAFGAPVLANFATGGLAEATFGYVIGYVLAGAALGYAARAGADRSVVRTALAATVATFLVYLPGVAWMMALTGMSLQQGIVLGVVPFLVGDAIKAAAAAALLPGAWRVVGAMSDEHPGT